MNKPMPNSESIPKTVAIWKQKGLSTRASYVLAKADISETGFVTYNDATALIAIRNCGSETAQELWNFITNFKPEVREVKFEDLIPN